MTVTSPVTAPATARGAIVPTPSRAPGVPSPSPSPRLPSPEDSLTLAHRLRWLEDVLDTLAAWEDSDDNIVLPEPLGGQRALHALRRVHDGLVTGQHVDSEDLGLVTQAVHTLAGSAARENEDVSEALLIHASGDPATRTASELLAELDGLGGFQPHDPHTATTMLPAHGGTNQD